MSIHLILRSLISTCIFTVLLVGCGGSGDIPIDDSGIDGGASSGGGAGAGGGGNSGGGTPNPGGGGSEPTPPAQPIADPSGSFVLSARSPNDGDSNRALTSDVVIEFSKPLMAATVTPDNIRVTGAGASASSWAIDYAEGATKLTLRPADMLQPYSDYNIAISANLMSMDGESLGDVSWSFETTGNIGATSQEVIEMCMDGADVEMLHRVNQARSTPTDCGSEGTFPATHALAWSCLLRDSAYKHSKDMADNNFHEHTGSDGSSAGDRVTAAGYRWRAVAENIAGGQPNIAAVMTAWIDSDGHCRNIMSSSTTEFGSALVVAPPNTTTYTRYWTQNFARPF